MFKIQKNENEKYILTKIKVNKIIRIVKVIPLAISLFSFLLISKYVQEYQVYDEFYTMNLCDFLNFKYFNQYYCI